MSIRKPNILVNGWFRIPHSYAIVNCFQLVHMYKQYKDSVNFYTMEAEYYSPNWKPADVLVYGKEYNKILKYLLNDCAYIENNVDIF